MNFDDSLDNASGKREDGGIRTLSKVPVATTWLALVSGLDKDDNGSSPKVVSCRLLDKWN